MKMKKLLSFMLCMVMLMTTALTGCKKEKTDEEKDAENNVKLVTLNMFIVTDDSTTDEQKQAVEIAINEITIKNYKAKVNINFLKEEEYWPAIEQTLADIDEYEASGKKKEDKKKEKEEKTLSLDAIYTDMRVNGININEDIPQIDIIVFNSYDKYYEYVYPGVDEEGNDIKCKLAPLDSYIKAESKILTSYIYPSYLEAAKLGGKSIYGIPVNGPIGTYEYIVIDRELAEKYITNEDMLKAEDFATPEEYNAYFDSYVAENFNTFPKFAPFLEAVKAGETDVIPLNKTTTPGNVEFYLGEGSPIGVVFEGPEWHDRFYSVYDNPTVREHFEAIYNYRQAGYIADETAPSNAKYAIQIIEGSSMAEEALEAQQGKDYIFIPYKYPKFEDSEVLKGVFAISAKSYNKDKAMEIITAFNTKPELANLLQWGVEDGSSTYIPAGADEPLEGSYKLDEEKTVDLINNGNGYKMDNNITGNKYIKYRLSGTPDEFEGQKLQNTQSWVGCFAGYNPVYMEMGVDPETGKEGNIDVTDAKIAEMQAMVDIAMPYYADFIAGTGDRPFDERYDELLAALSNINPLLAFDTHLWYNFSTPYGDHVRNVMMVSYPFGRISVEPEEEEEETAEDAETESEEVAETEDSEENAEESVEEKAEEPAEENAENAEAAESDEVEVAEDVEATEDDASVSEENTETVAE